MPAIRRPAMMGEDRQFAEQGMGTELAVLKLTAYHLLLAKLPHGR